MPKASDFASCVGLPVSDDAPLWIQVSGISGQPSSFRLFWWFVPDGSSDYDMTWIPSPPSGVNEDGMVFTLEVDANEPAQTVSRYALVGWTPTHGQFLYGWIEQDWVGAGGPAFVKQFYFPASSAGNPLVSFAVPPGSMMDSSAALQYMQTFTTAGYPTVSALDLTPAAENDLFGAVPVSNQTVPVYQRSNGDWVTVTENANKTSVDLHVFSSAGALQSTTNIPVGMSISAFGPFIAYGNRGYSMMNLSSRQWLVVIDLDAATLVSSSAFDLSYTGGIQQAVGVIASTGEVLGVNHANGVDLDAVDPTTGAIRTVWTLNTSLLAVGSGGYQDPQFLVADSSGANMWVANVYPTVADPYQWQADLYRISTGGSFPSSLSPTFSLLDPYIPGSVSAGLHAGSPAGDNHTIRVQYAAAVQVDTAGTSPAKPVPTLPSSYPPASGTPANDDWQNAVVIAGQTGFRPGTVEGATLQTYESGYQTVWYRYNPSGQTGRLFFYAATSTGVSFDCKGWTLPPEAPSGGLAWLLEQGNSAANNGPYAGGVPVRQYPRDDNLALGAVRQRFGSTSLQNSIRQGSHGTYS